MAQFLYGINIAGAEYGDDWDGWSGQSYFTWRTSAQLKSEMEYFGKKGFNCFRLPISWERLQNSLMGSFNTTYQTNLLNYVNQATSNGWTVIIDLHNYNRYATGAFDANGKQISGYKQRILGDGFLTNAHIIDVWTKLVKLFLGNTKVVFELMNEPHDFPITSTNYFAMLNEQIIAIRAAGSNHLLLVPNSRASDVDHWSKYSPNGGPLDSVAALAIKDSANNYAFAMHAYQDNPSSATSYSTLITEVTNWARTNKKKLVMTEMGSKEGATNGAVGVGGALKYMNDNSDVWLGWMPWNLPPYNLTPEDSYTKDGSSMAWYTPYLNTTAPTPIPDPTPVPTPTPAVNVVATTTKYAAPGDQGFTSSKVVGEGYAVPKGTYTLKAATRTTFGDNDSVSVDVILSNPHTNVDLTWEEIKIDLRGHSISAFWNCTIEGTSGIVTLKPTADTKTVLAQNNNSVGFNFKRMTDTSKKHYQVLIKSIKW